MNIMSKKKGCVFLLLCAVMLCGFIPQNMAAASADDTPFDALNAAINGTSVQTGAQYDIEAWNETVDGTSVRHIRLNADVNEKDPSKTILVKGLNVILDLNGHTLSGTGSGKGSYVLGIAGSAAVTVRDTSANKKGSITGGTKTTYVVNDQGTFHLESGTVRAQNTAGYAAYVNLAGSLTTSGNIYSEFIGIYAKSSSVTMHGGTIRSDDYGIYAQSSSVTMHGGTVDASNGEYGVYTYNKARFHMSGGEIKGGNQAGVCIYWGGTHTISGGTITGTYGVTIWGNETLNENKEPTGERPYGDTTLTVSGGTITGDYHGISGNGRRDNGYSRGATTVNIKDGASIHGTDGVGIYNPQTGDVNISGGNVTGITGIEMRSGNLTMTGGTVTGHADQLVGNPNGSGSTTSGAGIAVSQHTTKQPINITITGGTIAGYTSFLEDAYQGNSPEDLAKVKLSISGGQFVSKGDTGNSSAFSRHKDLYITGGMYAQPVGTYTSDKYSIDHLGTLTPAEMKKIPSTLSHPTGKVHCIRVEKSELPYHVGYLTGTGYSVTLDVGSKSEPLVPAYSLNGDPVAGNVACAAFVIAYDVNSQTDYHERSVIQKWTSGDEAVATVDGNGVVTAVSASPLPVKIIATLLNGETVTFPVTVIGDSPVPQTGDDSNIFLWLALLAVSYLGLAGILIFIKRRSNR